MTTVRKLLPLLDVAGLGMLAGAGFTLSVTLGLVVAGAACLGLSWHAGRE